MGGVYDSGMADQGVTGGWGLLVVDVETQTAETAVVEGGSGRGGVDEAASSRVHHDRARLDGRERGLVQQCGAVLLGQRVKTHEVGCGQQFVQFHHLGAMLVGHLGRDVRIGGQHRHFEGQRPVAHSPPYAAEADQAERGAGQLHAEVLLAVPASGCQRVMGLGDTAGGRQHQSEGVLGCGQSVGLRGVDHCDAPLGRGGEVDVVDAHAGAPDHPQARPGRDQLGVHPSCRCARSARPRPAPTPAAPAGSGPPRTRHPHRDRHAGGPPRPRPAARPPALVCRSGINQPLGPCEPRPRPAHVRARDTADLPLCRLG